MKKKIVRWRAGSSARNILCCYHEMCIQFCLPVSQLFILFYCQAVKTQSQPIIPVTFMDGSIKKFEVDPATTCKELCKLIKKEFGMKSIFGFSIYIAALEQVSFC